MRGEPPARAGQPGRPPAHGRALQRRAATRAVPVGAGGARRSCRCARRPCGWPFRMAVRRSRCSAVNSSTSSVSTRRARVHAGLPQHLVGEQVADPGEHGLVEQPGLDRSGAPGPPAGGTRPGSYGARTPPTRCARSPRRHRRERRRRRHRRRLGGDLEGRVAEQASYVEPYQGAATGVGGIVRDIMSMGARPVAIMDPLRFGTSHPDTLRVLPGVVERHRRLRQLPRAAQHRW